MINVTLAEADRFTHIHDVVKHDKRGPLGLWFISHSYLTYAAVAAKEVVQVLTGDLVVEVLDEQDAIRARREF